jgi:hypothetical protein
MDAFEAVGGSDTERVLSFCSKCEALHERNVYALENIEYSVIVPTL